MNLYYISFIGIVISLITFISLAWKGVNLNYCAMVSSLIIVILSGMPIIDSFFSIYAVEIGRIVEEYFILFSFSALFGKLVSETGIAYTISKLISEKALKMPKERQMFVGVVSIPFISLILTYSGISMFVVVFTLIAIAKDLFKELDIPWHFYTMSVFGTGTISISLLPGNPSTQNIIPTKYFGTTLGAAPTLGLICSITYAVLFLVYVKIQVNEAIKNNDKFLPTGKWISDKVLMETEHIEKNNLALCIIPLVTPFVCINILKLIPEIGLMIACLVTFVVFYKKIVGKNALKIFNEGINQGIMPLINFGTCAGFGCILSACIGYELIIDGLKSMPGPSMIQVVVSTWIASFVLGSSTAGETVALNSLSQDFVQSGINPQILHRLTTATSIAGGAPHAGPICNSLELTGLKHKHGYKHYFYICYVCGTLNLVIVTALAMMGVC